jgi:hypothetical protein
MYNYSWQKSDKALINLFSEQLNCELIIDI